MEETAVLYSGEDEWRRCVHDDALGDDAVPHPSIQPSIYINHIFKGFALLLFANNTLEWISASNLISNSNWCVIAFILQVKCSSLSSFLSLLFTWFHKISTKLMFCWIFVVLVFLHQIVVFTKLCLPKISPRFGQKFNLNRFSN